MIAFKIKDVGFGEFHYGTTDIDSIIPKTIPLYFLKSNPAKWNQISMQWFMEGIRKESVLIPIYGIDKEKAIKHVQCIFNSWALTKQQKVANAAFLLSQWFTQINL